MVGILNGGCELGQHNQTTNVHCGRVTASRRPCHLDPRFLDPWYCLHGHWDLPEAKELIALHNPPARGFQVVSSPTARQPISYCGSEPAVGNVRVEAPPWAAAGLKTSDSLALKVRAVLAERLQRIGYERHVWVAVDTCRVNRPKARLKHYLFSA